jgi:CTP synthase (UTP-ammonia lyase)
VIGDRIAGFEPQDSIGPAVTHAAAAIGVPVPELRWLPTEQLASGGPAELVGAAAAWGAPGGPFASLDGALIGIRAARESGIPFLGTCGGFQLGVIEVARNLLGHGSAMHAEYGTDGELFIDELLCSLVGQIMTVDIVDPWLERIYGSVRPTERYYCRFGLQPAWRAPLQAAGLRTVGVDTMDGDTRIMRLDGHPFFVLTLFVPQTSSTADAPHPLVRELVRVASGR